MAKLGWRVRSLAWILAHAPGGSVDTMTPEQMVKAQQRLAGHGKLAVGVTGTVAKGVTTSNRVIEQDGDRVPVRIYRSDAQPDGSPVIVHFHGGGWTLGALDQSDWLCSQVCLGVGAVVVSVDYRLAPTHRFPTAVLDSLAAINWVAGHAAELRVDIDRLAVMGDSAGGNLAAVITQLLRDRGGPADHPSGPDVPGHRPADPRGLRPQQSGRDRLADPVVGEHGQLPQPLPRAGRRRERPDGLADPRGRPVRASAGTDPGGRVRPAARRRHPVRAGAAGRRHPGTADRVRRHAARLLQLPEGRPRQHHPGPGRTLRRAALCAARGPGAGSQRSAPPGPPRRDTRSRNASRPAASRPVEGHPVGQHPVPQHTADALAD